jgi:uncharacterized protein
MTINLRPLVSGNLRPLVVGGIGLFGAGWAINSVTHLVNDWLPAIVVGSGLTWGYLKLRVSQASGPSFNPQTLTKASVETAVAELATVVDQLAQEVENGTVSANGQQLARLRLQIRELLSQLDRTEIRIAIIGGNGVGKTSLLPLLQAWVAAIDQPLQIQDTPSLFAALDDSDAQAQAWQLTKQADLVIFLTDGDITGSQMQVMQALIQARRRTLLVFNKQDQYLPKEQMEILAKLRSRLEGVIAAADVVAIATQPRPITVRQYQADGTATEWLEEPETQILPLTDRLDAILLEEGQKLVLASSLGNAVALRAEASSRLNHVRRDRALPLIEKAQWVVAGTAFVNPFPAVDLLATAAINTQLVLELSALYQQKLAIDQAKVIATTLAGLMVKLGVVEVSSQAVGAMLKTNAVTYAAGGLVQGVSGAYFTRLAGLTLMEYFEAEANLQRPPKDKLQQILTSVFQRNQRTAVIQSFVRQVVDRLLSELPNLSGVSNPAEAEAVLTAVQLAEAAGEEFGPAIAVEKELA